MARVLLVEPFYGGSHKVFLDGLVRHSQHTFELLTLPAGEWRRRMRLGAQELAAASARVNEPPDVLITSDMLDLPVFLALARPRFSTLPAMVYFHENQFTYPRIRGTKLNSWFGQINYLSALAATRVAFNSEFHRSDFLGALRTLDRQPNNWLSSEAVATIEKKSQVLPLGVELGWMDAHRVDRAAETAPVILWNHRWEFDKGPGTFALAVRRLADDGHQFMLALAGEPGPNPDRSLVALARDMQDRIVCNGYISGREEYARLLWHSDVVVSTTRHEFFGVGMVEALYCGCFPVAPDGFNYREVIPASWHDRTLYRNVDDLYEKLGAAITDAQPHGDAGRHSAARFDWSVMAPAWDLAIDSLVENRG